MSAHAADGAHTLGAILPTSIRATMRLVRWDNRKDTITEGMAWS